MGLARLVANVYMSVNREMETDMLALFQTIDLALNLYTWVLIASAIFSWLYAFNVINSSNQFVNSVGNFLYAVTEPVFEWFREHIPVVFGGIDFSPLIVIIGIQLIQRVIIPSAVHALIPAYA